MHSSPPSGTLILASNSPRRRELLRQAGLTFIVVPSMVDEASVAAAFPKERVRLLAEAKAGEVAERYPESWVIGADTGVLIESTMLGKPRTQAEARHMLLTLSGREHTVLTGYCICCKSTRRSFSETVETKVMFKPLTGDEIEWYISTGEPFDKAGGYAVQGLGSFLIQHIDGSYTSVVGLPVCEVVDHLTKEGVIQRGANGYLMQLEKDSTWS